MVGGVTTITPARVALGLAVLAAQRVRSPTPGDALATAVGLLAETGQTVRAVAGRVAGPPARVATLAVGGAARVPGASLVRRPLQRTLDRVRADTATARERGRQTLAASRAEAAAAVRSSVEDGIRWLVPRLLEQSLPALRAQLLPAVIDQLTTDARLREYLTEQGRTLVDSTMSRAGGRTSALVR